MTFSSKVLAALLPDRQYAWLMRYERFGMLIIMALVCFGAMRGEVSVVLTKATHICLECIGIG